ncbi:MAG: molybdopterin-binding protein [candidate division KSB1 bacterium]|nr:molybdopterin-binding protein [candidate division KSB1 bacterium]
MIAEVITIGDELLIGQVVNTNASWLGEQLSQIGIPLRYSSSG